MEIYKVIEEALKLNPSDIHLSVGIPPVCRVNGRLIRMDLPALALEDTEGFLKSILTEKQFEKLLVAGEIDISIYADDHKNVRLRMSAYRQRGSYSMALRVLNQKIPTFEELGLPKDIMENFCKLNNGLVLITGPTGTGKTTTITAMLDWINNNRDCHVITIEDPIEYYHHHKKSIIHQRETGYDTASFNSALRAALRQDPDIIFVGEMRDLESISIALTAAETGHLVLSTLHTIGAAKTVDRIIDVFPNEQQQQIRTQLSMVLKGVVSQQLLTNRSGNGRALAIEIMIMTQAIGNLIRDCHTTQIHNCILTGSNIGMKSMDASLIELMNKNQITKDDAKRFCSFPEQFDSMVTRLNGGVK